MNKIMHKRGKRGKIGKRRQYERDTVVRREYNMQRGNERFSEGKEV